MSLNLQLENDQNAPLLQDRPKLFDESDANLDFDDIMGNVGGEKQGSMFRGYVHNQDKDEGNMQELAILNH